MYIRNSYITFYYRILFLIVCALGIIMHFSVNDHVNNSKMIAYFTVQSAIFCFITFVLLAISSYNEIKYKNVPFFRYSYSTIKGMATLAIIITFLSYQFMLKELDFTMYHFTDPYQLTKDILAHYIVPFMVVLDWLLFQPKGLYRWFDTLVWLLFPFVYFVEIIIRGFYTNEYPYFFLNVAEIGILKVLIFVCIYITLILCIGFAFFLADKILSRFILPLHKE